MEQETEVDGIKINYHSHATVVLEWDGIIIYADPIGGGQAFASQKAPNIAFVTHEHGDHFDEDTLAAVLTEKTTLIVPQYVADMLPAGIPGNIVVIGNGETYEVDGFTIEAIPAYNLREEDLDRHVKGRDNGYVIEHGGKRVYFSGDTEDTPEMRALQDIDIAFVAMNLPYTMSVEDAADAVLEFAPGKVLPYHYRTPDGFSDVAKFQQIVNNGDSEIEVIQLDWYK